MKKMQKILFNKKLFILNKNDYNINNSFNLFLYQFKPFFWNKNKESNTNNLRETLLATNNNNNNTLQNSESKKLPLEYTNIESPLYNESLGLDLNKFQLDVRPLYEFLLPKENFDWKIFYEYTKLYSENNDKGILNKIKNSKSKISEKTQILNRFLACLDDNELDKIDFTKNELYNIAHVIGIKNSDIISLYFEFLSMRMLHKELLFKYNNKLRLPKNNVEVQKVLSNSTIAVEELEIRRNFHYNEVYKRLDTTPEKYRKEKTNRYREAYINLNKTRLFA